MKGPALVAAAVGAGVLFGRRFGQSASGSASSSFKINAPSGKGLGGLASGLGGLKAGIAGLAASLVGGAVFGGLKQLANEASDINETVSKSRNIFGDASKSIESFAKDGARNLGMSRAATLAGTSAFGNLFDQLGFGVQQSAKMSKGFAQMAADAGSFNNADPSDVMEAFLSATRGEYDALQKYIPTASAATIEAEAMRMTHKKSVNDLTAADKAAALYEVSVKGLGKAHGDFARTSGGFANQQRIAAANWADLRVKIGQYFLPMFTKATQYMNREGFDALTRIVGALGSVGRSAGNMAKAVWSSLGGMFSEAVDNATLDLGELADWFSTHQADMVRFFLNLGVGAINFGRTLTGLAAGGIRAFGRLAGGLADFIDGAVPGLQGVMVGMAEVISIFDKDAGMKIALASYNIGKSGKAASAGLRMTKDQAEAAARSVESKMYPAFDAAEKKLRATGNAEIWKAKQRDAAARAANAIRDIGTKADGSQIKLKSWNDRFKQGDAVMLGLNKRIKDARQRMLEQRDAGIKAGDTQAQLTKRWEKGREALYREFRQMGLSKREARALTEQYGKIPKKAETKTSAPGMKGTRDNVRGLDGDINRLNSKGVNVKVRYSASGGIRLGSDGKPGKIAGKDTGGGLVRASGGMLPGFTPGRDVHHFRSMSPGVPDLSLSGGEPILRPEVGRVVGKGWVDGVNRAARTAGTSGVRRFMGDQHFAAGGVFRRIEVQGSANRRPNPATAYRAALGSARAAGERQASSTAARLAREYIKKAKEAAAKALASGGGNGITSVPGGRGLVNWHGGRFTRLAAANLQRAQKIAGQFIRVFQGGWRPRTSYSGSSHAGDAIDSSRSPRVIRAIRAVGWASGDRTGLGNWMPHSHSVPSPSTGRAGGSARGQYQDYRRRGGARQGLRSPWGLADGALVRGGRGGVLAHVGEGNRDELVTPLPRNWKSGGGIEDLIKELLQEIRSRGLGDTTFKFETHNPLAEPNSVTASRALQKVANLGLVE